MSVTNHFRILKRVPMLDDIHYIEAACISTDYKPTGWAMGSWCLEVDTATWYSYNEATGEWDVVAGGED